MRPLVHTEFSFILTSILFHWSVCLFLHSLNCCNLLYILISIISEVFISIRMFLSVFFKTDYYYIFTFESVCQVFIFLKISVTTTCRLSFSHKWVNYGSKQPPKLSGLTQEFISFSECVYHMSWCVSEAGDGICSATSQVLRLTEVPTLYSDASQLLSHQRQGKAAGELCTS